MNSTLKTFTIFNKVQYQRAEILDIFNSNDYLSYKLSIYLNLIDPSSKIL